MYVWFAVWLWFGFTIVYLDFPGSLTFSLDNPGVESMRNRFVSACLLTRVHFVESIKLTEELIFVVL